MFNLAASASLASDPLQAVVHTRTIVNPQVGLKLTGKVGNNSTLASIYAIDELPEEDPSQTGTRAHFPIFRYKHALGEDSYLGAVYAGRELRNSFNRVAGTDGLLRVTDSGTLEYSALFSQTKAADDAPQLGGYALTALYRHGSRDLDFLLGMNNVSEDFSTEAGFLTRRGVIGLSGLVKPKIYPASELLRRIDLQLSSTQLLDQFSELWETSNAFSVTTVLPGALSFRAQYTYSTEVFLAERFRTDGFLVSGGGQFTRQVNLSLQYRKSKAIFFSASPYQGTSSRATASILYQPWNQLEFSYSFTYSDFYRDSSGERIYEYPINRLKLTYQLSQYLFLRGITEVNNFRKQLLTDFLASFTYVPGTVVYLGYGSLYQKIKWENNAYVDGGRFLETKRGFFFKMSYLWRV